MIKPSICSSTSCVTKGKTDPETVSPSLPCSERPRLLLAKLHKDSRSSNYRKSMEVKLGSTAVIYVNLINYWLQKLKAHCTIDVSPLLWVRIYFLVSCSKCCQERGIFCLAYTTDIYFVWLWWKLQHKYSWSFKYLSNYVDTCGMRSWSGVNLTSLNPLSEGPIWCSPFYSS